MADMSIEEATARLRATFTARRSFLRGAVATGLMAAGAGLLPAIAGAQGPGPSTSTATPTSATTSTFVTTSPGTSPDSIQTILNVFRTAEQLAVTLYSNGIRNAVAGKLNITGQNLNNMKAALVEEQIHQLFFTAQGGQSLADTFSFPDGDATFTDVPTFVRNVQVLEGVFDSGFLAGVREFAQLGQPDLATISAQVAWVEGEHRVLARAIVNLAPPGNPDDNWSFAPVLVESVGTQPDLVSRSGYLSPRPGNSFKYMAIDFADPTLQLQAVVRSLIYGTPILRPLTPTPAQ
jgi:hypothetical protein